MKFILAENIDEGIFSREKKIGVPSIKLSPTNAVMCRDEIQKYYEQKHCKCEIELSSPPTSMMVPFTIELYNKKGSQHKTFMLDLTIEIAGENQSSIKGLDYEDKKAQVDTLQDAIDYMDSKIK